MAADFEELLGEIKNFLRTLETADACEVEWEAGGYGFKISRPAKTGRAPAPSENGSSRKSPRQFSVVSPVVGVFHFGEDPPLEGNRVKKGELLGYVEAVSVKHAVEAESGGVVCDIHVKEGEAVEFGRALFTLTEQDVS